ncbi:hypothetical protein PA598K_01508 [Paenibacillus sp. 598K]|uniref:HNH endonuclease n=1 Tax=Paenibacillus sp. 598K TaxID=1117987 RepID=UPI000FFAD9BC|nr:HNH endonuclease [Paenibacillus sp. 598K]GBF73223.1 hypothetical protein PA598K_01508 [Paenibacillus sp. 598K]
MKPWAKSFYNSTAWKRCRESYIKTVHGLCERCGAPGKIVHHKVYLTPQNIDNPAISLNHELLEYVCQDDHNREHHGSHEPLVEDGLMFDEHGDLIQDGRESFI